MDNSKIIEEKIYNRQYQKNHKDCLFLIAELEEGGFGAMVARRKLIFQIGHAFDRTILIKNSNRYLYDDPYTNYCQYSWEEIVKIYKRVDRFYFSEKQRSKICYFNFTKYWNSEYKNKYQCWCDPLLDNNYLYFSGLILSQLKIKDSYLNKINEIKGKLNFNLDTIGLHIRRGDKEKKIPIDIYMKEIKKLCEKSKINRIFVCSDSSTVFSELKNNYEDFDFFQDSEEKKYNNANWDMVRKNRNLREQETFTAIKIIELLSSCKYIVGQHNTQFVKLAGAKLSYKVNENRLILISCDNFKPIDFGCNSATS